MAVTTIYEDGTWKIHLDALLSLRKLRQCAAGSSDPVIARPRSEQNGGVGPSERSAPVLLTDATFDLRLLALEMEALFRPAKSPRKLAVRKVYAALLRIRRNLALMSQTAVDEPRYRDGYSCLEVTSGSMLVTAGSLLDGSDAMQYLNAHQRLRSRLLRATDSIFSTACEDFRQGYPSSRIFGVASRGCRPNLMQTIWSLSSILSASTTPEDSRTLALELLRSIGEKAFIPQAIGMASAVSEDGAENTSAIDKNLGPLHRSPRLVPLPVRHSLGSFGLTARQVVIVLSVASIATASVGQRGPRSRTVQLVSVF